MVISTPRNSGYVLIIVMMAVFVLAIALTVAVPVWETQSQREKELELIFRGRQYVEAVRIFQLKNPGRFPSSLEELIEIPCMRKLYREPMTKAGSWDVILNPGGAAANLSDGAQQILVAPERALPSIRNPAILGVVSPSTQRSIRLYEQQDSYDKWLFYYGHDPKKQPRIVRYSGPENSGNASGE